MDTKEKMKATRDIMDVFVAKMTTQEELDINREHYYSKRNDPPWLYRKKYPEGKPTKIALKAPEKPAGLDISSYPLQTAKDIRGYILSPEEYARGVEAGAKKEFNGVSRIENGPKRVKDLPYNQRTGAFGEIGGCKHITGSLDLWEKQQLVLIAQGEGDGGTDILLDNQKIDFKTSRMKYGLNPLTYHLIIPPNEFHDDVIYVACFLKPKENPKEEWDYVTGMVYVCGWMRGPEIKPFWNYAKHIKEDRYHVPVKILHKMDDFPLTKD